MTVKDQLNRTLQIPELPQRIVSLVPSQTELLIDLGLKHRTVGITKFCVHPPELRKELKVVGGTKTVHYDKIGALEPDLIICNKEENTLEMVEALGDIAPVWVSDISSLDESLDMILKLGDLLDVPVRASKIIESISSEAKEFAQFMIGKSIKKVAYLIWKGPYMAAGTDTFIQHLLALNKFENITARARYPEISLSTLKQADLVLLSSEPYPFKQQDVLELEAQLGIPVQLVDGEFFSWYGSRMESAFGYFRTLH